MSFGKDSVDRIYKERNSKAKWIQQEIAGRGWAESKNSRHYNERKQNTRHFACF